MLPTENKNNKAHAKSVQVRGHADNFSLGKNGSGFVKKVEKDTDRDNFMSAQESKEYGMIDEVLVKSDKE